jgi:integrase
MGLQNLELHPMVTASKTLLFEPPSATACLEVTSAPGGVIVVATPRQRESRKSMTRRRGQKGVVVAKRNFWHVRFYADVPDQKERVRRSVPVGSMDAMTKTEARLRAIKILADYGVNTAEHLRRATEPIITFKEHVDKWVKKIEEQHASGKDYADLKPSTFRTAQSVLNIHLARFNSTCANEVSQQDVDALVEELAAQGKSKNTIKNIVVILGIVLGRTFNSGKQLKKLKCLKPRTSQKVLWFTLQQVLDILAAKKGLYRVLFATAAGTGMRAGELLGLRVQDVDLESRMIMVNQSSWDGKIQSTKSENADRTIGIDDSLAQLLKEWIGIRKEGYVFPSRRGTPLRVGNVVKRELWPVLETLKIERKGLHAFRHFRVTALVEAGVPAFTIKAWIGHGSDRMVARYTHSRPAYHQQHLANVPSVLKSSHEWTQSSHVEIATAAA